METETLAGQNLVHKSLRIGYKNKIVTSRSNSLVNYTQRPLGPLHITTETAIIFLKSIAMKIASIYKTVEKVFAVAKIVVVCTDNNCLLCGFNKCLNVVVW